MTASSGFFAQSFLALAAVLAVAECDALSSPGVASITQINACVPDLARAQFEDSIIRFANTRHFTVTIHAIDLDGRHFVISLKAPNGTIDMSNFSALTNEFHIYFKPGTGLLGDAAKFQQLVPRFRSAISSVPGVTIGECR